jgi:hypothetical protein
MEPLKEETVRKILGGLKHESLLFSRDFDKQALKRIRVVTKDEVFKLLSSNPPYLLHETGDRWIAVNKIGEEFLTIVFAAIKDNKVFIITAYPSKEWEKRGYYEAIK